MMHLISICRSNNRHQSMHWSDRMIVSKQVCCHPKLYSRVVWGLCAVRSSYTWVVIEETKRKSSCKLCSINHFLYDFLPLFGSFSLPLDLGNLDERKAIYFSRNLSRTHKQGPRRINFMSWHHNKQDSIELCQFFHCLQPCLWFDHKIIDLQMWRLLNNFILDV